MPRKSTFNASEVNRLFEICVKFKNIIECKKTDCVSTKQKEEAWDKITSEFNAMNEIDRDAKELKTKYKNVKFQTKSKAAETRRSIYGTGGGPATSTTSAVEERMLEMLNDKEKDGVENICDSDTVLSTIPENEPQHFVGTRNNSPSYVLETPLTGPATLRPKTSAPLWTGAKKSTTTSWEKLASVKTKWSEEKLKAEVSLLQKEQERVELQMKIMREKHEFDLIHQKERQELELEILRVRLQREKLHL